LDVEGKKKCTTNKPLSDRQKQWACITAQGGGVITLASYSWGTRFKSPKWYRLWYGIFRGFASAFTKIQQTASNLFCLHLHPVLHYTRIGAIWP